MTKINYIVVIVEENCNEYLSTYDQRIKGIGCRSHGSGLHDGYSCCHVMDKGKVNNE